MTLEATRCAITSRHAADALVATSSIPTSKTPDGLRSAEWPKVKIVHLPEAHERHMNNSVLHDDYPRLRMAILRVIDAAKAESQAFTCATAAYSGDVMQALRQTHLDELDAVQALAASLELFDRRLTREGVATAVPTTGDESEAR